MVSYKNTRDKQIFGIFTFFKDSLTHMHSQQEVKFSEDFVNFPME